MPCVVNFLRNVVLVPGCRLRNLIPVLWRSVIPGLRWLLGTPPSLIRRSAPHTSRSIWLPSPMRLVTRCWRSAVLVFITWQQHGMMGIVFHY